MTLSADSIDPGLVTELHAKLEAATCAHRDWQRRAEVALRLAESHGKELADLRATLAITPNADAPEQEAASSAFWFASWREMRRLRAEDKLRILGLEREVEELRCGDLVPFQGGELPPPRADKFRAHLGHCEDCQKGLLELMQLDARVSEISSGAKEDG